MRGPGDHSRFRSRRSALHSVSASSILSAAGIRADRPPHMRQNGDFLGNATQPGDRPRICPAGRNARIAGVSIGEALQRISSLSSGATVFTDASDSRASRRTDRRGRFPVTWPIGHGSVSGTGAMINDSRTAGTIRSLSRRGRADRSRVHAAASFLPGVAAECIRATSRHLPGYNCWPPIVRFAGACRGSGASGDMTGGARTRATMPAQASRGRLVQS